MLRLLLLPVFAVIPVLAHADARADVQRAFERILSAGGFVAHASGNVFGPGTPLIDGDIEVIFPDRIRATTSGLTFIVTPHGAWAETFGHWTPVSRDLVPIAPFDPAAMRAAIASIRDVREVGRSKSGACPATVYRFISSGQLPTATVDGTVRAWVCDGSHRLSRVEATDRSGGQIVVVFDLGRKPRVDAPGG